MPKKVYDNILVPFSWYNDLVFEPGRDEPNPQLGKNRLWYLYMSARNGEQVLSGEPAIDYTVQGLLHQLERMKKDADNKDVKIAQMRDAGATSDEIGEYFGVTGGAIRKTLGWREYMRLVAKN